MFSHFETEQGRRGSFEPIEFSIGLQYFSFYPPIAWGNSVFDQDKSIDCRPVKNLFVTFQKRYCYFDDVMCPIDHTSSFYRDNWICTSYPSKKRVTIRKKIKFQVNNEEKLQKGSISIPLDHPNASKCKKKIVIKLMHQNNMKNNILKVQCF